MEKGQKVALLSIGVNIFLFGMKYFFALQSGSMALKAEAIHSLADVIASATVLVGLVIARRKTRAFPYGLYKVENLVAVLVSLAIFYAGYEIVMESLVGSVVPLQHVESAIACMVCAMAVTYGFSRYELRISREIASPGLMADARHVRMDMFAAALVVIGLLPSFWGVNLDRFAAIPIALFVFWSGGKILVDGIRVLLDASLDYQTLSRAERMMKAEPLVREIRALTGRNSGRYKFIEAQLVLETRDLRKADFIADRIEDRIKRKIDNVDRVLLHVHTAQKEYLVYALPVNDAEGCALSRHFGEAPWFARVTVRPPHQGIADIEVIANPFTRVEQGKGILAAKWLIEQGVDAVVTRETFEGRGPYYVFSDASVKMLQTTADTIADAMADINAPDTLTCAPGDIPTDT
jgi:cation diffusion facilitator family transporter